MTALTRTEVEATMVDWKFVPTEPTNDWAESLATLRQGRSSEPRCEPPSEGAIVYAKVAIADALATSPEPPPEAFAQAPDGGEMVRLLRVLLNGPANVGIFGRQLWINEADITAAEALLSRLSTRPQEDK